MKRLSVLLLVLGTVAGCLVLWGGVAAGDVGLNGGGDDTDGATVSGIFDFKDVDVGGGLTQCPQAGSPLDKQPKPIQIGDKDKVEQLSNGGDDIRVNQDYACMPQDETTIAVNPLNQRNIVAGANDYRLGWGSSGFYSSTDSGNNWYDGIKIFPTPTNGDDHVNGGGDPAVVFDRGGTVYYAEIHFERLNDTNGVFVSRSTNGGFTWSRPCISFGASDSVARCGGTGDPRTPGDGVVAFNQDNDNLSNGSVPIHDKEYIAAGPRPAGVGAVCFAPISKTVIPAGSPGCPSAVIGPDRLYVTWTIFFQGTATINLSFSDDRGHSWSPRRVISGSAPFCAFGRTAGACDSNQFSVPTVNPTTGFLYVAFENFNTEDENQYLLVRSKDGGQTFEGPFFVTPVFDTNYPRGSRGRSDCVARGQSAGRRVLTNSCFRVNAGGNVVVDQRGGAFADDLYLVMSDNRNGTVASSNTDVFLFKSTDGGSNWVGPTRVNDDPSAQPANRNCQNPTSTQGPCPAGVNTGNDQWYPWVAIGSRGDVNVVFEDRRLDTDSTATEWPTSRTRTGNYLVWFWGAQCSVNTPDSRDCVASSATTIPQPTTPINPGNEQLPAIVGFPFKNFTISDNPSNWDYTFRAGIFAGDYRRRLCRQSEGNGRALRRHALPAAEHRQGKPSVAVTPLGETKGCLRAALRFPVLALNGY